MALAVQGLTSDSVEEKMHLVETLVQASAGTNWMHESFDVQNPKRFTRSWFCWADSLFVCLYLCMTGNCLLLNGNCLLLNGYSLDPLHYNMVFHLIATELVMSLTAECPTLRNHKYKVYRSKARGSGSYSRHLE
jgi:hypothetical protein